MDATWLPPLSSEDACQPKKLMSRSWTSRTRTLLTSLNGSLTTSSHPSVISLPRDSRWPWPSLVTLLPSKRCSRESLNSSLLCSEERPSSIGIPEKVNNHKYIVVRYGRNGIHWSRIQHERSSFWVLIILGCYCWGREWVRWGRRECLKIRIKNISFKICYTFKSIILQYSYIHIKLK